LAIFFAPLAFAFFATRSPFAARLDAMPMVVNHIWLF
jgi:hypothetical protein